MDDLVPQPSYAAPMIEVEPGMRIMEEKFLKELMHRISCFGHSWDLSLRRLHERSYAIEIVIRPNTWHKILDINCIAHADSSALANKYLASIKEQVYEFSKPTTKI